MPLYTLGGTNGSGTGQSGILARSVDLSNATMPLGTNALTALPPRITLPPTTMPVMLYYSGNIVCTTGGVGVLGLGVGETTSGSVVDIGLTYLSDTWVSTSTFPPLAAVLNGHVVLEPSTSWRNFRLIGALFRDSGSLAASLGQSASSGNRAASLTAVAA